MLPPDYVTIEVFSRVAPLGIRFIDAVTRRPVLAPLNVTAYANPAQRLPLFPNPSNIYVLQNVPGLRQFEFGAGDEAFWNAMPTPRLYTIEVRDPMSNYLPFQFTAQVPTKGVFSWSCPASPPAPSEIGVPLYATVGRSVPAGVAKVRADLYDPQNARPASWAVLDIFLRGVRIARGIADAEGRISISLPYPEPIDLLPASPLELGQPFSAQEWTIEVRVRYTPQTSISTLPDLCALLSQPAAHVWDVWDSATPIAFSGDTLRYGKSLVLRSHDSGSALSVLFVTV